MPAGDRTGPEGLGPMTGRAVGYCSGSDRPGRANRFLNLLYLGRRIFGRRISDGRGLGFRPGGQGRGRNRR